MSELFNSLKSTILTIRKHIYIYDIKIQQDEHNNVDKQQQGILKVLIEGNIVNIKQQIKEAEILIDKIILLENKPFTEINPKDIITKLDFCINQNFKSFGSIFDEIKVLDSNLKNLSDNLMSDVDKYVKL